LSHHVRDPEDLRAAAAELFALVAAGTIRIEIARTYPLQDAAQAHRDVESRTLSGSAVLLP
jgi:NADPH2:quinone reductase